MDTIDLIVKYAPQYIPIVAAFLVILFTRNYIYRGMVPQAMLDDQIAREQERLVEQITREKQIIETAKDIEQHLEEIVYQLSSLTKKVSEEITENNARITSLERFLSDEIDVVRGLSDRIQDLAFQCERTRKGIPDTTEHRVKRRSS